MGSICNSSRGSVEYYSFLNTLKYVYENICCGNIKVPR